MYLWVLSLEVHARNLSPGRPTVRDLRSCLPVKKIDHTWQDCSSLLRPSQALHWHLTTLVVLLLLLRQSFSFRYLGGTPLRLLLLLFPLLLLVSLMRSADTVPPAKFVVLTVIRPCSHQFVCSTEKVPVLLIWVMYIYRINFRAYPQGQSE